MNDTATIFLLMWLGTFLWIARRYSILSIYFPLEIVAFLGVFIGACLFLNLSFSRSIIVGIRNGFLLLLISGIFLVVIVFITLSGVSKYTVYRQPEILKSQAWWCLR